MACRWRRRYAYQDCYWGRIMGESLPTWIKAYLNAMETSQLTFNQKALSLRLRPQLGRLSLLCFGILIFRSMVKMWILHHTAKFCRSFGMQFAENVQANWQEEYCFNITMPDPTQPPGENSSTVGTSWTSASQPRLGT
jgi:hypothetical protein